MNIDLLGRVVAALERADITYMVVGSFASTFHSGPRMTRDIDIVVDSDAASLQMFVDNFDSKRFYIDDATLAIENRSMFNVIDTTTGWKADIIICKDRPFSANELNRRVRARIGGVSTFVASAEDTVLSKLEWLQRSGSERQLIDVVAIFDAQNDRLDEAYLDHWANELGLTDELNAARDMQHN